MFFGDILAQTGTDPSSGLGDLLVQYGPFAPFAALLLFLLNLLWKDNKAKEAEIKRLTDTAMEKVLPLVLESTRTLSDAVDAVKEVRTTTAEAARLAPAMKELQDALEEVQKILVSARKTTQPRKRTGGGSQ